MISWLLSLLTGGGRIVDRLADAYEARERAKTDVERLRADTQVAQWEAELSAQREANTIRRATVGQWEMRVIVFTAGFPPSLHFAAVCADSLNWFPMPTVDRLPPPMDQWQGAIILSLFGLSAVKLGASVIGRRR